MADGWKAHKAAEVAGHVAKVIDKGDHHLPGLEGWRFHVRDDGSLVVSLEFKAGDWETD